MLLTLSPGIPGAPLGPIGPTGPYKQRNENIDL